MKTNSPEDAEIIVQKLPSDMGIHRNPRKGTLNAPEKLLENFEFEREVMIEESFPNEFSLEETHSRIEKNTEDLLEYRKPILSIGGDHSVSFPVLKAMKRENPEMKLIWLDSHLDLKQKVNGHVSHDVAVRELLEHGFSEDEITFVGITRIDEDEQKFLKKHDMQVYIHDELKDFLREFESDEHPFYVSVDIDVLKEDLAPGTGYPDGELSVEDVKNVIETVEPGSADLVEVAPPLDQGSRTVENGREILSALVEEL